MKQTQIFSKPHRNKLRIYDIYHDESKKDGYWHGFLFVPRAERKTLLNLLNQSRKKTDYYNKLHYVKLRKKQKWNSKKAKIIHAWTTIGISSLQQQKYNKYPPCYCLGKKAFSKDRPSYKILPKLLKCRFAIFREKDNHKNMFQNMDELKCIETTFRMGIKGAIHKMFSQKDPIKIGKVYIDGDKQYLGKFRRTLDINRTLIRLATEKRNYVSFDNKPTIIAQDSNHNKTNNNKNNSHLLQLTDILIGGFRFFAATSSSNNIRYKVSKQCKILLNENYNNYARMQESRYNNGFNLSEAWLSDNKWKYQKINNLAYKK